MKALELNVLKTAMEIQDSLLGPTINFDPKRPANQLHMGPLTDDLSIDMRDSFHAINGLSNSSWFFHSPLQYWACSTENVAEDKDIITTVNQHSKQATSVNVTLRHSIVFSGKRFENHRLVAADALVITLIHMIDSPVGRQWERKAEELALKKSNHWNLYPEDGRSLGSMLYEFRFQPLSSQDDLLLGLTYAVFALYFATSLSQLRALKSRLGLIFAVMTQIALSIMSSFTICAIFKIDLSQMPRALYPIVILAVGLGNIFRFINAVIITPPQHSISARMGEALGQTAYIAIAGVAQNLVILWVLGNIGVPQIRPFCIFAAIAILFDFFYLLTFFAAVLSVDVQRTELSDTLGRASLRNGHLIDANPVSPRKTWLDALLTNKAPFSTTLASSVVMIGIVLIAQRHFFDNESWTQTGSRMISFMTYRSQIARPASTALLSVDIHQARTPTAWLRLQDHQTAHEVIKVIKPNANRYIARVYDPLIFVVKGSDRTPNSSGVRPFLPAAYDFLQDQFGVFLVTVVIIVAAVSLLMNYLLWDDSPDGEENGRSDDDPLLAVKTLNQGHVLDILFMAASADGIIVSVELGRLIRVWDIRVGIMSYAVHDPDIEIDPFPILGIAIDSDSNWLALLSGQDKVFLWNIPERRWGPSIDVEVRGRRPAAFFFGQDPSELVDPLYLVRYDGLMSELHAEPDKSRKLQICRSTLNLALQLSEKPNTTSPNPPLRILTSSKKGCIHIATEQETGWTTQDIETPHTEDDNKILSILTLPLLGAFLAIRDHSVDLIDVTTHKTTYTFKTTSIKPGTLRCFHSTRRRPQCGSVGLASLALAYTSLETGECILQSYLPRRDGDTICFRSPSTPGSKTCCLWRETVEHRHVVENPGQWEALPSGYLIGVRKRELVSTTIKSEIGRPIANTGLRRRGANLPRRHSNSPIAFEEEDSWEVWSLSARGERSSVPLCGPNEQDNLLISSLGPMTKVGKRSIAVGLGNVVKVITVGIEKFDGAESEDDDVFVGMSAPPANRRKKTSLRVRKQSYS